MRFKFSPDYTGVYTMLWLFSVRVFEIITMILRRACLLLVTITYRYRIREQYNMYKNIICTRETFSTLHYVYSVLYWWKSTPIETLFKVWICIWLTVRQVKPSMRQRSLNDPIKNIGYRVGGKTNLSIIVRAKDVIGVSGSLRVYIYSIYIHTHILYVSSVYIWCVYVCADNRVYRRRNQSRVN